MNYCPKNSTVSAVYYLYKLVFSKFLQQTNHLLVYHLIFSGKDFPETKNKVTLMKTPLVVSLIGKLYRCKQSQLLLFKKENTFRKQNHLKKNRTVQ